ncbi:enoyl-CoA hydratase/isomerase family protein [Planctomycetota bacterium]
MKTHIHLEIKEVVAYLVLTPEPEHKPPAFDHEAFAELDAAIEQIERQPTLRAAVISSASRKHFLVGANIRTLATFDADTIDAWVRQGHTVFNRLEDLPLPVFVKVNGNALGAGLELALACDFIIAGPQARFALPEANLGLITGQGGAWRLRRRVGPAKAHEMLFTGKFIDALEAKAWGLCDVQGSLDDVDLWLQEQLAAISRMSPRSIAETKAMLQMFDRVDRERSCEWEVAASRRLMAEPDTMMRLKAFFENRKK